MYKISIFIFLFLLPIIGYAFEIEISEDSIVYSEADTSSLKLGILLEGQTAEAFKTAFGWTQIEFEKPDTTVTIGFIKNDYSKTGRFSDNNYSCFEMKLNIDKLKVGMLFLPGSESTRTMNNSTWEGIIKGEEVLGISSSYFICNEYNDADFLLGVRTLYNEGCRIIVAPGYQFETTIYIAQDIYPDVNFVLLDGTPHNSDYSEFRAESNVVSVFFAEHEAGFIAGVAAAIEIKSGSFGFIGGMEIPPVQKYNWGFQQGIHYANRIIGTDISINEKDVVYQGTFSNIAAGQRIASDMYDNGVDAIFCVGGAVGLGAIREAQHRSKNNESVWIIGVDVDQFKEGLYDDNKSVVLTSAVKRVDQATFDMINAGLRGDFPEGETLVFDSRNYGIGIPPFNQNLSESTVEKICEVFRLMQSGYIKVRAEEQGLIP